ncbi:MAG: TonB-dependent receptor plug domain-containing protein, partial [Bacteroidia bacterium]|nr:TonB-dependent receptor plug domain-containing protein [Bacteroidia bacterium]
IKNIPLVLGERDILKVATTLPGISTAGEGSNGYNVRGGKTDQNLIILDNAAIYNPSHFFGIFSAINPFTTGKVDIYKGNIPAEYGGRLSSVFDITTKDADTNAFKGEASIGPVTSNLIVEIPVVEGESGLMLGGRSTYSGWILRALDEESLRNSEASFFDVIGKYNHKINDNNTIKATGYYSKDKFSITSDSIYGYSNRLVSVGWDHKFNDDLRSSVTLTNSEYQFDIAYDGDFNTDFDLNYKNNETELKLKFDQILNDDIALTYGLASKLYAIHPGNFDPLNSDSDLVPIAIRKERGLESAAFVSGSFEVNDELAFDAGLRYSLFGFLGEGVQRIYEPGMPKSEATLIETLEFGNNEFIETFDGIEARLSARYYLTEDFSVKASYNNTYQYIHTLSTNTTVSPTDTWKLSDRNIRPQRAEQYVLGFYKNFDDHNYEVSVEAYYKNYDDILDYKVGAQLLLNETLETEVLQGIGRSHGIEFLVKKNKGRFNGWIGYTYSKTELKLDSEFAEERVNNGDYFPANYDKPHDFNAVINYKMTQRFSFSANFAYQTGRPITYPIGTYMFNNAEYTLYSDRNKFRIPDYFRLDIGFNYEGNHRIKKIGQSFWNLSIYNVLGRNNPYSVYFVTEDGQVKAYQNSIFSIPVPTLTFNFKF